MKLLNKIRNLSRKAKVVLTAVLVTVAVAVPLAVNAEWYPVRPVYDYNKYDGNNNCADPKNIALQNGRCGSMNGPVFNSFINTPSYGDERAFFDGRRSDKATNTNADAINDVTNGSKEVVLRTYVHNNANQSTNASGLGVAKGTKVRIALPTAEGQVLRARSYISATNAAQVEDTTDMLGTSSFKVSYVPGSARLLRGTASYALSDSIVSTGALIGDKTMNGNLPGCFDYAALVEIHVKITVTPKPDLQLTKEVRKSGTTTWNKEISAKPGDKVQWILGTKNIGNVTLNEVKARDVLPPHLDVVPGSVKVYNGATSSVQNDAPLFGGGLILNTYPVAGVKYVMFETTVKDDFSTCTIRLRNLAYANSKETPTEDQDSAVVNVTKDNCTPPTPTYSCDMLKAEISSGRLVKFTTTASATNGASIVKYIYTYGDGKTEEFNAPTNTANHTYAADGNYSAKVQVVVSVNGTTKTIDGANCATTVNFNTPTPNFTIEKGVRVAGSSSAYGQDVTLKYGDKAEYQIMVTNTGSTDLKNVVVKDTLPAGVTYEAGTLKVNGVTSSSDLFGAGVTIPSIAKGAKAYVTFTAQVNKIDGVNCDLKQYRNVASADPEGTGTGLDPKSDDANVSASCDVIPPKYSCDLVNVVKQSNRTIQVSVKASATGGAVIKQYTYNFGDGGEQTTDKDSVTHQYTKDGKYVVRVKVLVGVNNQTVTVDSDNCAKAVEFTSTPMCTVKGKENLPADSKDCKEQTPPSTPPVLPDTGAGSVAAIFAVVVGAASYGYYALAGRRQ
jgi:uncharacterized repeat protein (TIGR01451 family)